MEFGLESAQAEASRLSLNFGTTFKLLQVTQHQLKKNEVEKDMKFERPLPSGAMLVFDVSSVVWHKLRYPTLDGHPDRLQGLVSGVYKGKLTAANQVLDAVCKLIVSDDGDEELYEELDREANAYRTLLQKAWGDLVPDYYGEFEGQCMVFDPTWDPVPVRCILLEDCGDAFDPYGVLRARIDHKGREICLQLVMCLHKLGVSVGESPQYSFVQKNGVVKMIDFPDAVKHHECPQKDPIRVWTFVPPYPEDCCEEIYSAAYKFRLWMTGTLYIGGRCIQLDGAPEKKRVKEIATELCKDDDDWCMVSSSLNLSVERAVNEWYHEWGPCVPFMTGETNKVCLDAAVLGEEIESDAERALWRGDASELPTKESPVPYDSSGVM